MLILTPEYKPAGERPHESPPSGGLIMGQFKSCGFPYAARKYLTLTLLLKFDAHLTVARSLSLPQTRSLTKHHPQAPFKYLRNYLALTFDIQTRAAILSNHYAYLSDLVSMNFIDRICRGAIPLWEASTEEHRYSIELSYPRNEEGELFLVFSENGDPLYTLAFTIAPGKAFNVTDDQVLFIGRMQGGANKREALKRASKSFEDLIPAGLLLSATRAIAATLNISGIVGVSARNQVCKYGSRFPEVAASAYDEFWTSAGGEKLNEQFYYLPVPQTEKPLSEIKNNHRSRVKRKRQVKYSLMEQVSQAFSRQCLAPVRI